MNLWPHQTAGVEATLTAIRSRRPSGLLAMPTGSGKSVTFTTIAQRLAWPALILVHRDELVRQTIDTVGQVWPKATVGVVKASSNDWRDSQQVVIASVQTLRNGRLAQIPRNRFGLIVADECHHAVADTWCAVLDHFSDRKFLLGVSATPTRSDGRGLDELFGPRPLYTYPIRQAIADGVLCRLAQYAVATGMSVDGVSVRCGDFVTGELSDAVNTPERNRVVVESFQKYAGERRVLAFTVDVAHAHDLADMFNEAGISAAAVDGSMPLDERRETLDRFRVGDIRVVTNCAVLTEGFDDCGISATIMARPTRSRSLYTQCIGRGLRRADGKTDCLVLDYADSSRQHKLITALDLFGNPTVRDASGGDVISVVDKDAKRQEDERLIESLHPLAWRLERVCPWPEIPNLQGYVASDWWHKHPASDKQTGFLQGMGLDVGRDLTKGEACFLLDRAQEFRAAIS